MPKRFSLSGFLVGLSTTVVLAAVALSLLGYGAATAIETIFGIPTELTYDTPLDLLHLSNHAISGWMEIIDKLHETAHFKLVAYAAAGVGLALTMLFIGARTPSVREPVTRTSKKALSALSRIPGKKLIQSGCRWLRKQALSFIPFAVGGATPWLLAPVLKTVILIFALMPLIGYVGAKDNLKTWIVSAEYCSPISGRNERMTMLESQIDKRDQGNIPKITPCLSLWKNGSLVAEGRHIASTERAIILFDPVSGNVTLEPTEGISIRVSGYSASTLRTLIEMHTTDN